MVMVVVEVQIEVVFLVQPAEAIVEVVHANGRIGNVVRRGHGRRVAIQSRR